MSKFLLGLIVGCALIVLSTCDSENSINKTLFRDEIEAYHFHTYFVQGNERNEKEAMEFRKATRARINDGFLGHCSLNRVVTGKYGPHLLAQYELCCNKSSVAPALAWHMQNRGALSVLIHPLTIYEYSDHASRATWIGPRINLDLDCQCMPCERPSPLICPIYPDSPDEVPTPFRRRINNKEPFPSILGMENYIMNEETDSENVGEKYDNCSVI